MKSQYKEREYPWNLIYDITQSDEETYNIRRNHEDDTNDIIAGIDEVLNNLKARYAECIKYRYIGKMSFDEIGMMIGNVTGARADQIVKKAIRIIRHPSRIMYIRYGYSGAKKLEDDRIEAIKLIEKEENSKCVQLDSDIGNLNLSIRAFNSLYRIGLTRIRDVIEYAKLNNGLSNIRNLGVKSILEIENEFIERGMIQDRIFSNTDEQR